MLTIHNNITININILTVVTGGAQSDDNFNLFEDDPIEDLNIDLGDDDVFIE